MPIDPPTIGIPTLETLREGDADRIPAAAETRVSIGGTLLGEIPPPPIELLAKLAPAVTESFGGEIAHLKAMTEIGLPAVTDTRQKADVVLGDTVKLSRHPEQACMQLVAWLMPLTASLVIPRIAHAQESPGALDGLNKILDIFRSVGGAVNWAYQHWIISTIILVLIMTQVPILGNMIQGVLNVVWKAATGLLKGTLGIGMKITGLGLKGAGKAGKFMGQKGIEAGGKGMTLLYDKTKKAIRDPELGAFKEEVDQTLTALFMEWQKKEMTRAQMVAAARTLEDQLLKITVNPRERLIISAAVADFKEKNDIQGVMLDPESQRVKSMLDHIM